MPHPAIIERTLTITPILELSLSTIYPITSPPTISPIPSIDNAYKLPDSYSDTDAFGKLLTTVGPIKVDQYAIEIPVQKHYPR